MTDPWECPCPAVGLLGDHVGVLRVVSLAVGPLAFRRVNAGATRPVVRG